MINYATGQPIRSRLRPGELRETEIRPEVAQGPVPDCLIKPQPQPVTRAAAKLRAPDGPAATRKE